LEYIVNVVILQGFKSLVFDFMDELFNYFFEFGIAEV